MTGPRRGRASLPGMLAVLLATAGCDANPAGLPFATLDREMAGVYNAATPGANLNLTLVLGTRHTVTGRYEHPSAGLIRFGGTWERRGDRLTVTLDRGDGLPSLLEFDVTREEVRTEIVPGPFSMIPENAPPLFLIQEIVRLRGSAVVAGVRLDLDLVKIISDIGGGGGGPTQT